jgi:predicted nucleic acid-binding protein
LIVVDASVLANAIGDDAEAGRTARGALAHEDLSAPDLVDIETLAVLRKRWLAKTMTARRFSLAVDDLQTFPIERYPALLFLRRGYELRADVTAYDATYVALAEELGCALLTADARLASAPGIRCPVTVLGGA